MLYTAFVWGLGVSCGAAFGLIAFFLCFWGLQWLCGRDEQRRTVEQTNAKSLEALCYRNELTEDTNRMLSQLVAASHEMERAVRERD